MKINIPRDWFLSRAPLEEGVEIGAGSLHFDKPALKVLPAATRDNFNFSRFVSLMRRKKRLTIQNLAMLAEADVDELSAIEEDPTHVPELSTAVGMANVFKLPTKEFLIIAGLAEPRSSGAREQSERYAACSTFTDPLTPDEEAILQSLLKVIIEDSNPK